MKLRVLIGQHERLDGERCPSWYRVAYWQAATRRDVCYPIGLHLIVRACRRLWEWSHIYRPSSFERAIAEAWRDGFKEGRRAQKAAVEADKQQVLEAAAKAATYCDFLRSIDCNKPEPGNAECDA